MFPFPGSIAGVSQFILDASLWYCLIIVWVTAPEVSSNSSTPSSLWCVVICYRILMLPDLVLKQISLDLVVALLIK